MNPEKPLGHKSYGTIGHLPGSRQGRDDKGISLGQAKICLQKPRDKHDCIVVQEKLDGTNVSVANVDGTLVPLIRAGYPAVSSHYEQHRIFAAWAFERLPLFDFLKPGERACGEWLAQAHGTRYKLIHDPFVVFDIMRSGHERALWSEVAERTAGRLVTPTTIHQGPPCSIEQVLKLLGTYGFHGAIDPIEGAVWRVERKGVVDFLAKYVRPEKVDGLYLPELSGQPAVWNYWQPS